MLTQRKRTDHTAVHYGYESRPGEFSLETTPQLADYEELTPEYTSGVHEIPSLFTATIVPKKSPIYLRAHVIIDGKHYWSDERTMKAE